MSHEQKAEAFIAEAQKKMTPTGLFSFLSQPRYDDAAELFAKAANAYKLGKKCIYFNLNSNQIHFFLSWIFVEFIGFYTEKLDKQ